MFSCQLKMNIIGVYFDIFYSLSTFYFVFNPVIPLDNCSMNVKAFFGENLKLYRKEKLLTQEQLSEKVSISVKHLSAIERGLTFVSAELLEKISLTLEIPISFFFMNNKEIFYNDNMLDAIDRIIEKHLIKTIDEIKADIRQNGKGEFVR